MEPVYLYETTFDMTLAHGRRAVRRYLRRTIGWGWWVVGATVVLVLGAEYALGEAAQPIVPWSVGWLGRAALILAGVYVLTIGILYWIMLVQTKKQFAKLESPNVWIGVGEEGIGMRTSEANSFIKWRLFVKLWRFEDLWLLFQNQSMFIVLPVESMPDGMRRLIVKQVEGAGCKVD